MEYLIDIAGFLKMVSILKNDSSIDYIYGNIKYISEDGSFVKKLIARKLTLNYLVNNNPGIFQPGSFFKKSFTDKIGLLDSYNCCFDYEYVLRILANRGTLYQCDFSVAEFRLHTASKTGSIVPVFIKEQMLISKKYGRKSISWHTLIAQLRLFKHNYLKS